MNTPTTGDALRRALVSFPAQHGGRQLGRLIYINRAGKAKVRLQSGVHLNVRSDQVHVIAEPPRAPRSLP